MAAMTTKTNMNIGAPDKELSDLLDFSAVCGGLIFVQLESIDCQ